MNAEMLVECRSLAEKFKREMALVHDELDGLAAMLKHGFEAAPSNEDVACLAREVASLRKLLESLQS